MLLYKRNIEILIKLLFEKQNIIIPSLNFILSKINHVSLAIIFKQNRICNIKDKGLLKYRNYIINSKIHILLNDKYFYLDIAHKRIISILILTHRLICTYINHKLDLLISNWVSLVHQLKPIITIKAGSYWVFILNILECENCLGIRSKVLLNT